MRRVFAALSAIVLLLTAVGGAAGARPYTETDRVRDAGCWNIATPDGTAEFYLSLSDLWGADAFIDVWEGEPYNSDLAFTRDWDRPVSITFDGTVSAVIPVLPSGDAVIAGTLDPLDTIEFTDSFRDGNTRYRTSGAGMAYAFSGTLTLPGSSPVAIGPDDCGASDVTLTSVTTQPHASVLSWSSTGGSCSLTNADGDSAELFMSIEEGTYLYLDGWLLDSGGTEVGLFGYGEIAADGTASLVTEEYDPQTGQATGGTGSASVTLTETGDDVDYVTKVSNVTERVSGSLVDVAGTLTASIGSFDLDPCVVAAARTKIISAPSNGPKPGGKRPANDLPAGAVTLAPGGKAAAVTKGAQPPSEAGYPCMEYEDEGETFIVPVSYTVWYKVAGTGAPLTVDTAGSDFDTVMAVYAGGPDAASTVACVDDVAQDPFGRSYQAAATFDTIAGTTYWVQIGGFGEYVGAPNYSVPYGSLRVTVR